MANLVALHRRFRGVQAAPFLPLGKGFNRRVTHGLVHFVGSGRGPFRQGAVADD